MQPCCASEHVCSNVGKVDECHHANGRGSIPCYQHAYADGNGHRYPPHADINHHGHSHTYGNTNQHLHTDVNHHPQGYHDTNSHLYTNINCNTHTHRHTQSNKYTHSNQYSNANSRRRSDSQR